MNLAEYKPNGMSWREVGEIAGMDRSMCCNIARRPYMYAIEKTLIIAKIFGVDENTARQIWIASKIEHETEKIKQRAAAK